MYDFWEIHFHCVFKRKEETGGVMLISHDKQLHLALPDLCPEIEIQRWQHTGFVRDDIHQDIFSSKTNKHRIEE